MTILSPAVLRLMLGALFVSTFFENLEKNLYTVSGYSGLIDDYAARNNAPSFWSDHFMKFISDHASFFAPVQAVFELSLGILLVLGLASGVVALVAATHLTALWVSELGIFWVWELLSLIVVAVVVGLAFLPPLLDRSRPVADRPARMARRRAWPRRSALMHARRSRAPSSPTRSPGRRRWPREGSCPSFLRPACPRSLSWRTGGRSRPRWARTSASGCAER